MKKTAVMLVALFGALLVADGAKKEQAPKQDSIDNKQPQAKSEQRSVSSTPTTSRGSVLKPKKEMRITVHGQGVAPTQTMSPAQAYALAKRAALADGYRQIAERVKGVRVEGYDVIKNMMVTRSSIRTTVDAIVKDAAVVETVFKEGLCEVEMEIVLNHSEFSSY